MMSALTKIKKIYHKTPQPIKNTLLYVPYRTFLGASYGTKLEELRRFSQINIDEAKQHCEQQLLAYLNKAIRDTPFYTSLAKEKKWHSIKSLDQFFEFPLITKEHITDDLIWFLPEGDKKHFTVSTGGTSGKQTELHMSNNAFKEEWAYKAVLLENHGVSINSKRICLRGVDFFGDESPVRYNPLYKEIQVSPFKLNESVFPEIISRIRQFKPKWIHGYPSSVYEFAKLCHHFGIYDLNIKATLLVSEKLYPEQAKLIKEVFACSVISFYGMTERVIFAPREADGTFIPDMTYGYTEEEDSQLIGTGFINHSTRLIRYCTNDEAEVHKKGNLVTKITNLKGRWGKEYLIGKNKTKITMTSLNVHSDELNFIKKYQFVQSTRGECALKIVVGPLFTPTNRQLKNVVEVFQRKVGEELNITLEIVDEIPLTARGKHVFIKNTLI